MFFPSQDDISGRDYAGADRRYACFIAEQTPLQLFGPAGLDYVVPFMISVLLAKAVGDSLNEGRPTNSQYEVPIIGSGSAMPCNFCTYNLNQNLDRTLAHTLLRCSLPSASKLSELWTNQARKQILSKCRGLPARSCECDGAFLETLAGIYDLQIVLKGYPFLHEEPEPKRNEELGARSGERDNVRNTGR